MPRSSKSLPAIPVKHTLIRKVLNIAPPLEKKLRAYITYYTEQQGLEPTQAPTDADTIIALVENFLDRDGGFNQYLRSRTTMHKPPSTTADPKKKGGDLVNGTAA